MADLEELIERVDAPLAPKHRCRDFDEDCASVPGTTPDGETRSHLSCWLHDPTQGWCPYLKETQHADR